MSCWTVLDRRDAGGTPGGAPVLPLLLVQLPLVVDTAQRQWHDLAIGGDLEAEHNAILSHLSALSDAEAGDFVEVAEGFLEFLAEAFRVFLDLALELIGRFGARAADELVKVCRRDRRKEAACCRFGGGEPGIGPVLARDKSLHLRQSAHGRLAGSELGRDALIFGAQSAQLGLPVA